ncbi:nuclear transport factor 2 family protein [Sphaerisporangium album]|uniref:Nuclear transport factor 2 family protein n=1 Tax=Sphaerisporangium album TaxID=509200 RepID=A0A367FHX6_9ACTN|nr:ester cyclase [Sphaerisporangium album]RCG29432.1 nuclear transport factor 2 family protein [Sphaerisporangium album]
MPDAMESMNRVTEAFNRHHLEAVVRCYGPRAALVTPSGIGEGPEQISFFWEAIMSAFPDMMATIWTGIAHGDTAVSEWTVTGTHGGPYMMPGGGDLDATGRPVVLRGSSLCSVDDGGIESHRIYYDQLELASQLGYAFCPYDADA